MLSLVIPTYNEAENLPVILPRIAQALRDIPHEVIIVDDDSPDGTWRKAEEISEEYPSMVAPLLQSLPAGERSSGSSSLLVIRRRGERGLSSAVIAGFKAARGEVLVVMDADGQHDAFLLSALHDAVRSRRGIAVASRYIPGGGTGQWNARRTFLSRFATACVTMLCRLRVRDPMSGFFAIDRALFERIAPRLPQLKGFKILFDLLMRLPPGTPVTEVPYTFAPRLQGRSKLSLNVQWDFASSLLAIIFERWARAAWVAFLCIVVAASMLLCFRAWNLRLLVTDAALRDRTGEAFRSLTRSEGWLISDLSLRSVTPSRLELFYRPHDRSGTPARCIRVRLDYFGWYPCDAS